MDVFRVAINFDAMRSKYFKELKCMIEKKPISTHEEMGFFVRQNFKTYGSRESHVHPDKAGIFLLDFPKGGYGFLQR